MGHFLLCVGKLLGCLSFSMPSTPPCFVFYSPSGGGGLLFSSLAIRVRLLYTYRCQVIFRRAWCTITGSAQMLQDDLEKCKKMYWTSLQLTNFPKNTFLITFLMLVQETHIYTYLLLVTWHLTNQRQQKSVHTLGIPEGVWTTSYPI